MKKTVSILLALLLLMSLAACGGTKPAADAPAADAPAADAPAADAPSADAPAATSITLALESVPNGLDPSSEDLNTTLTVCSHIYDKIVEFDTGFNWVPGVADSWNQVDQLTWQFTINMDMMFQNGEPIEMDDVVYSIERLKEIPKTSDAASCIDTISTEGNVLSIKLKEPNGSSIAKILSLAYVFNKSYIEEKGDVGVYTEPCGTGPYKVTSFTPGGTVVLETWEGYAKTKPAIDKLTFVAIAERQPLYCR